MISIVITSSGGKYWYFNNQRHRANGPAVVWANGTSKWFWHDDLVTENTHRLIVSVRLEIWKSGRKVWFSKNRRHRANGPSMTWGYSGRKQWHWYGKEVTEYEHMMLTHVHN